MYRFKSKADGDLLMMAPVGEQILRIIGREPAPQGIIELAAIPAAIAALEQDGKAPSKPRGRRSWNAEARRAAAVRMKNYWDQRRQKAAPNGSSNTTG